MEKYQDIKNLESAPLFFKYFFIVKVEKKLEDIPTSNTAIDNKLDDYSKHISTICNKTIHEK